MKFNFKKVLTLAASAVMMSSTLGFAAAATYPAPFVEDGTAAGAVIVGANSASSDWAAAIDLSQDLNNQVTSASTTTDAAVTGEAAALFSSGTRLYINDTLDTVTTVLTKSDLPTILADEAFSGNVDATMTQTIVIGKNPTVKFAKQPTSANDPGYGLATSTTTANYIYNSTITFSKAVNLSHADSEGEDITMFGQKFTIAAATTYSDLVVLKEAEKLNLDSEANPSQEVSVGGETYTVELVSASDSAATIKVTDSSGASNSKEIDEAASKKVQGLTIAVQTADETNLKLSSSLIAGAEKLTLTDASSITSGEQDTVIDGTNVEMVGTVDGRTDVITKLTVQISAPDSDHDAIIVGEPQLDPVFGSFKIDFAGLNIEDESTSREEILIVPETDDKMQVTFSEHRGNGPKTITYAKNHTTLDMELIRDDDGRNISVREKELIKYQEYVVVGNENEGYLLKLSTVKNATTGTNNDYVKFTDVFSGDVYSTVWTSDGTGTVSIQGKSYGVTLEGVSTMTSEDFNVTLDYPDSSSAGDLIFFPTIETEKGAKLFFYKPQNGINLTNYDDDAGDLTNNERTTGTANITKIKLPDGDGYTDLTIAAAACTTAGNRKNGNWTLSGAVTKTGFGSDSNSTTLTVGQLRYNLTMGRDCDGSARVNLVSLCLLDADAVGNIKYPAIGIIEEKDDNTEYHAVIVETEPGASGDDGMGVNNVIRTWGNDAQWNAISLYSDSKKTKEGDLYGTIIEIDSSDSDQKEATISYPDSQIYAQVYIAEDAAAITAATATSGGGGKVLVVKDSEVSSVSGSNLIVVGGSCINSVAAKILGSDTPVCGDEFSALTNVAAGQYLIKVVTSPYSDEKIAMLVAGYDAQDTTNAAAKAKEGVATDVDTEQVYPITSA